MTDENSLKLKYINENILEKGYNPEELSNFIIRTLSRPIESISFDKLKEMIEEFKVQRLQETYLNMQTAAEEDRPSQLPSDPYYSPAVYEIKTLSQQENTLLTLSQEEKKIIHVKISDPKKAKKGKLFSKAQYIYRVTCPEINSDVRRTYSDFEWLKNQMVVYYALRQVPPIIKEQGFIQSDIVNNKFYNEEEIEEIKVKYLNFFMNSLTQKKILRTSPFLCEFLQLSQDDFKKYKDFLGKYKFDLSLSFDNFKTTKGSIHCDLKPSDIKIGDGLYKKYTSISEIYTKLEKSLNLVANDFQNLIGHMLETSTYFGQLGDILERIEDKNKKMTKLYTQLNKMFESWSSSYDKQSKFFRNDLRNVFNFMGMEMLEMEHIYKKYLSYKKEYEDFTNKVNKKKEFLWEQKDYNKWSVQPGTEDQISKYLTNKKLAFEKMLYQESEILSEEKKRVACTLYVMNKQFRKLLLHQGENLEKYWAGLKENNQEILGDAFHLIKLFTMKLEEEEDEENKEEGKEKENKEKEKNVEK